MKYKKPICDCGEELFFEIDEVQMVTYKILKNGMVAKRPYKKGPEGYSNGGNLICNNCGKQYEYNKSFVGEHKFKMLRGEEM